MVLSNSSDVQSSDSELAPGRITIPNRTPAAATQMIKFHASLNVSDLKRSIEFYSALFGCEPVKSYPDYAKFETDVPPLVLSLKPKRACAGGPLNHLGLRLVNEQQLRAVQRRLEAVGARIGQQDDVKCCYARQTKLWITDPDETLWEVYVLHEDVPDWGEKHKKLKLFAAPLKAFGIGGVVRRWWHNTFGKTAAELKGADQAFAAAPPHDPDEATPADTCTVDNGSRQS